jgi:hypothetical protein
VLVKITHNPKARINEQRADFKGMTSAELGMKRGRFVSWLLDNGLSMIADAIIDKYSVRGSFDLDFDQISTFIEGSNLYSRGALRIEVVDEMEPLLRAVKEARDG